MSTDNLSVIRAKGTWVIYFWISPGILLLGQRNDQLYWQSYKTSVHGIDKTVECALVYFGGEW